MYNLESRSSLDPRVSSQLACLPSVVRVVESGVEWRTLDFMIVDKVHVLTNKDRVARDGYPIVDNSYERRVAQCTQASPGKSYGAYSTIKHRVSSYLATEVVSTLTT
jgi:hypothetical protein